MPVIVEKNGNRSNGTAYIILQCIHQNLTGFLIKVILAVTNRLGGGAIISEGTKAAFYHSIQIKTGNIHSGLGCITILQSVCDLVVKELGNLLEQKLVYGICLAGANSKYIRNVQIILPVLRSKVTKWRQSQIQNIFRCQKLRV